MDYEQYKKLGFAEKQKYMQSLDIDMVEFKEALQWFASKYSEYDSNIFAFIEKCLKYRLQLDSRDMLLDWLEFKHGPGYIPAFVQKNKLGNIKLNRMIGVRLIRGQFRCNERNYMFTAKFLSKQLRMPEKTIISLLEGMEREGFISSVNFDSYREIQHIGYIRKSRKYFME